MTKPQTTGEDVAGLEERAGAILDRYRPAIAEALRAALDAPELEHLRLMRYQLGWEDERGRAVDASAGKMLRPALCLLACEALGRGAAHAMPAAVAVELVHNFTLIHDDIEDSSTTRHGRPTLWKIAGVPLAINAGDGMFVLARRALLDLAQQHPAERVVEAARILDDACVQLCEGQHGDLSFEQRDRVTLGEYAAMIQGKSAALLAACCQLGAVCGGAGPEVSRAFGSYGLALGLAFQVRDDLLGIWGDPNHTGKSARDDIRKRKKSFPYVFALETLLEGDGGALRRLYAQAELSEEDVHRVVELLTVSGAREAADREASGYSEVARESLADIAISEDGRRDLETLATFSATRTA